MSRAWKVFVAAALVLLAFGGFAYYREFTEGMSVTGMRNLGIGAGATWGLYITFVVYFIGLSFAGITVAALIRLFKLDHLRPLARMGEVLTLVTLTLGALAIIVDLGQPVRGVINLFRYARPQSPFFGTFTMVIAGYFFVSLVYLFLSSRRDAAIMAKVPGRLQGLHRFVAAGYQDTPEERERHRRASFWLALAIVPVLVIAHSTLGFVFGLQVGRPGWYSALQAPGFVVLAEASGIGMLIVLAAIVRRACGGEDLLNQRVFAWLGKFLTVAVVVYLYFMVTELLTAGYAGTDSEVGVTSAILTGSYAWLFWSSVALLVLPLAALAWQAFTRRWTLWLLVASGVAVNLAAIGKRYLIAVPSQTDGQLLPYVAGSYSPTWIEYAVIVGLIALGALAVAVFMKLIPIIELPDDEEVTADAT